MNLLGITKTARSALATITMVQSLLYLTGIETGILIEGVTVGTDQLVQIATHTKSKKETVIEKEIARRIATAIVLIVDDMKIVVIVIEEGAGVEAETGRDGVEDAASRQILVKVWIVITDVIISLAASKISSPQHHSTALLHLSSQISPPLASKSHPGFLRLQLH